MLSSILLSFLPLLCTANIWDNIFSRLQTKHHLTVPDSDKFQLQYKRTLSSYILSVDFAKSSKLWLQFDMDIGKVYRQPIVTVGIDLPTLLMTFIAHTRSLCWEIQLPKDLEFVMRDRNFTVDVRNVRGVETLMMLATRFKGKEQGKQGEEQMYVYEVQGEVFGGVHNSRKLQGLADLKDLGALAGLGGLGNLGKNFKGIQKMLGGNGVLNQETQEADIQDSADDQKQQEEYKQDPIEMLDRLREFSKSPIELKFNEKYLKEFKIANQTFTLLRKQVQIVYKPQTQCRKQDWQNRSALQIVESLQKFIYAP